MIPAQKCKHIPRPIWTVSEGGFYGMCDQEEVSSDYDVMRENEQSLRNVCVGRCS